MGWILDGLDDEAAQLPATRSGRSPTLTTGDGVTFASASWITTANVG